MHLSLSGVSSTSELASLLHKQGLVRRLANQIVYTPPQGLLVDFRNVGRFTLADISVLLLLIRRTAEHGRRVEIRWPSIDDREQRKRRDFLARIGFDGALRDGSAGSGWQQYISFLDDLPLHSDLVELKPASDPSRRRYVPLTFFDKDAFLYNGSLWRARPILFPMHAERFRRMLRRASYLNEEAINALLDTIYLEVAWNTVLHSEKQPSSGYGVFCAQVQAVMADDGRYRQDLHFCVADLGVGIPRTLASAYRSKAPLEIKGLPLNSASRMILFALTQTGTRRRLHVSESDREAFRGLDRVADLLKQWGELEVRSNGGLVRLDASKGRRGSDELRRSPLPGTQVSGVLRERSVREAVTYDTPRLDWIVDLSIKHISSHSGQWRELGSQEEADRLIKETADTGSILLFDCGYVGGPITHLQYLMKAIIRYAGQGQVVLWNVAHDWSNFRHLAEWIPGHLRPGRRPPLVVRGPSDIAIVGAEYNDALSAALAKALDITLVNEALDSSLADGVGPRILRATLPVDTYLAVSKEINTSFLREGFTIAGKDAGFFEGTIHLMSGRRVGRFFSLTRYLEQPEATVRRWSEPISAKLLQWLHESENSEKPLKFIGFAYPARMLLAALSARHQHLNHRAYNLLTYDVPTDIELATVVSSGDRVLLVTDVVSTGSLTKSVEDLVIRCGGKLIGIIAIVDAHAKAVDFSAPFWAASLLAGGEPQGAAPDLWVDPVSMVPAESGVWDTEIDPRVDETLALLVQSSAVEIGHYIDGSRHASVNVEFHGLLDPARHSLLLSKIEAEVIRRLSSRGWEDFSPRFKLFPAGIRRLEEVFDGSQDPNPQLTVYATAVRAMSDLLTSIWPDVEREIEVPRVFDPDGRSRCVSTLTSFETNAAGCDVLIVDDGIWTGRTSLDLIRLAAGAGATRICILPLLARMSASELRFWESLKELSIGPEPQLTAVCFVIPLFLPIPFFASHDCPYEMTLAHFARWKSHDTVVSSTADKLALRLRPFGKGHLQKTSKFIETWLHLRAMAELAAENQAAVENLGELIAEVEREDDPVSLDALFSLFLEEWQLLNRPRLRQVIRPRIQGVASNALRLPDLPTDVLQTAMSLLRSLFPQAFIAELRTLILHPSFNSEALERCVFHAYTLLPDLRNDPRVRDFAVAVRDRVVPEMLSKSRKSEDSGLILQQARTLAARLCDEIIARAEPRTTLEAAEALLAVYDALPLWHRTFRRLTTMIGWQNKPRGTLLAEAFTTMLSDWREERRYLERDVVPLLRVLSRVWNDDSRTFLPAENPLVNYLSSAALGLQGAILADLAALEFLLERLSHAPDAPRPLAEVISIAKRLYDSVVKRDSVADQLLRYHFQFRVRELIESARAAVRSIETASGVVACSVSADTRLHLGQPVFIPKHVWNNCLAVITTNLQQHAFTQKETIRPRVQIRAEPIEGGQVLRLAFLNNGAALNAGVIRTNGSTQKANSALDPYGGKMPHCFDANEPGWTVGNEVFVRLALRVERIDAKYPNR